MASFNQICDILFASIIDNPFGEAVLRRELSLRMEQRDFFNLSMPEAKAPLRDSTQALLPPASIRCANATSSSLVFISALIFMYIQIEIGFYKG